MLELEAEPSARRQDSMAWGTWYSRSRHMTAAHTAFVPQLLNSDSAVGRKPLVPAEE